MALLYTGAVLIGVDPVSLTSFTVISPSESIYMEDCYASTPFTSPGVIYLQKTMPAIQYLITHLQNISSCHQLGPIDLFGLGSPRTSGMHGLPTRVKSLTFQMLPTSTPNVNVTKPQAVGIGKTNYIPFTHIKVYLILQSWQP